MVTIYHWASPPVPDPPTYSTLHSQHISRRHNRSLKVIPSAITHSSDDRAASASCKQKDDQGRIVSWVICQFCSFSSGESLVCYTSGTAARSHHHLMKSRWRVHMGIGIPINVGILLHCILFGHSKCLKAGVSEHIGNYWIAFGHLRARCLLDLEIDHALVPANSYLLIALGCLHIHLPR